MKVAHQPVKRPQLFVLGAPKCGTTAVTRYLEAHPAVAMAPRKDLHFFGSDLGFRARKRMTEAEYLEQWRDAPTERLWAESSVWYLASEQAAKEIDTFSPGARVIALLRHPTQAMYALWSQNRLNGLGDEVLDDFAAALAAEPARMRGEQIPAHTPLPSALWYRHNVRFSEQLARYQVVFGERLRVIIQEEMAADTAGTVRDLYAWLGIDTDFVPPLREVNTHKEVRSEGLRRLLRALPPGLKELIPDAWRTTFRKRIRKANSVHVDRRPLAPALRSALDHEFEIEVAAVERILGRSIPTWHAQSPRGTPVPR